VDGLVFDARNVLLSFDVLQTVGLIPAGREDVEGDLTTNGISNISGQHLLHKYSISTKLT
jgi:hypothetical protein